MRPLRRRRPPKWAFTTGADCLLLQTRGEYCAMCEVPLPDEAHVLEVMSGHFHRGTTDPGSWNNLLPLCAMCRDAHQQGKDWKPKSLMFPNRHKTFSLPGRSAFTYELEKITLIWLNEAGAQIDEAEQTERVIITGTTRRAKATVDHFALNTRWYEADSRTLFLPRQAHLSREDSRLDMRTSAWRQAVRMAEVWRNTEGRIRVELEKQTRTLIALSGFWSCWATVFWGESGDLSLMSRLLMPEKLLSAVASFRTGPGHHQPYPGTRMDWKK